MELIDYLKLARDLTGSVDIKDLMVSAKYLQSEMEEKPLAQQTLSSTSWMGVRTITDFLPNVKIQHPVKGYVDFAPLGFQSNMVERIEDCKKRIVVVNSARQMGMTTTLSALALYRAATRPNHTVLVLGNKFIAALEAMERIRAMIETCQLPLPFVKENNKSSIQFNNGSKIIARAVTKDAARGLIPNTIIVHEAAFISWSVELDWWLSLQPFLEKGAQVILSSTPNKNKGIFYRFWQADEETLDILKLKYIWSDNPMCDEAWAKFMRSQMSAEMFKREHEGEFLEEEVQANEDQTNSSSNFGPLAPSVPNS